MTMLKQILSKMQFWKKRDLTDYSAGCSLAKQIKERLNKLTEGSYWVQADTRTIVKIEKVRVDNMLRTQVFLNPIKPRTRYYNTRVFVRTHIPI